VAIKLEVINEIGSRISIFVKEILLSQVYLRSCVLCFLISFIIALATALRSLAIVLRRVNVLKAILYILPFEAFPIPIIRTTESFLPEAKQPKPVCCILVCIIAIAILTAIVRLRVAPTTFVLSEGTILVCEFRSSRKIFLLTGSFSSFAAAVVGLGTFYAY
jgi:hypothetical protein